MSLKRLNITLLIMVVTVIIDRAISPLVPMALSLLIEILTFPTVWWYRKLRRARPANLQALIQHDKELQARRQAVRATARPMYAAAAAQAETPTPAVVAAPAQTAPVLPAKPKLVHTSLKPAEAPAKPATPARPHHGHAARPSASYLPRLRQARPRADYANEFIGSQY